MATVVSTPERLVILEGVSWETYERLLSEQGESCGKRFTYDEGVLEIMVLSSRHERPNRTLATLVEVLAEEWGLNIERLGSTTFKRADLEKGFEPDSCFYIQHADQVGGKEEIDLTVDPPPDLVIEVDITRESLNRFSIFGAVGIPEVWRFGGEEVKFYRLEYQGYKETPHSVAFPAISSEIVTDFLTQSQKLKSTDWLRAVRAWARSRQS